MRDKKRKRRGGSGWGGGVKRGMRRRGGVRRRRRTVRMFGRERRNVGRVLVVGVEADVEVVGIWKEGGVDEGGGGGEELVGLREKGKVDG